MIPEKPPSLLASFRFAVEGVWDVVRTQRNFRIHLGFTASVIVLGFWVGLSREQWSLLTLTIGRVLIAEMFNTAAETLVDLASPDYHPLAKRVKDLAAGAVLLSALIAVVVGLLLFGPPLALRLGIDL
ncbi:MAG: diacylglycerol kinase family protein [Anaerolineae bacterium]|nr:diacylglycerol kinase family protein [Anaerolineae bacterium]